MRTTLRTRAPAACLAILLVLTGCADRDGGSGTVAQSPTATAADASGTAADPTRTAAGDAADGQPPDGRGPFPPTGPPLVGSPTAPPSQPTELRRANVLAGRLSHGGDGPCYTLVTDDGREYALYGTGQGSFATGTWVRVTTGPATPGVDCGPGLPVTAVKLSPVG
ncbi:hypothetical protein [Micromonospora radicis]|uniref:Secreted protein n=1 Tax=Micromonospora radicis TaxID=1894971 RepID=A0A418MR78_9ACTN|nr:hypothetical protein [Micromonospora radicis]RIV36167.1 hypothetical protein D2L64_20360 [Micromonospora radicis]